MSQQSEIQDDWMVRPRSHTIAEDEVNPKSSQPLASNNSESNAMERGSLGFPTRWKAISHDLCPSSLLTPALRFLLALLLIVLWHIRCPGTDYYAIPFEVTFMCIPVQDSVLQIAYKNSLLPSHSAFINCVQKYSRGLVNSLNCDSDCIKEK